MPTRELSKRLKLAFHRASLRKIAAKKLAAASKDQNDEGDSTSAYQPGAPAKDTSDSRSASKD